MVQPDESWLFNRILDAWVREWAAYFERRDMIWSCFAVEKAVWPNTLTFLAYTSVAFQSENTEMNALSQTVLFIWSKLSYTLMVYIIDV